MPSRKDGEANDNAKTTRDFFILHVFWSIRFSSARLDVFLY